jgi:hypothetical protein
MTWSPKELFGLILRLVGLFVVFYGFYGEFFAIVQLAGFVPEAHYTATSHALVGLVEIIFGLLIVINAARITNASYKSQA